jgi:hypothetical protein
MKNLLYLQEGLLKEDHSIVSGYIDELDMKTANDEMVKAGEKFGFKTILIHGKVYGLMAEIAGNLGYLDPSSYGRLLKKWDIYTPTVGGFGSNYRRLVVEKLGVNEYDGSSLLVDWTGFLIGGVKGEGKNADAVLAYLLEREREARINAATVDQVKAEEHTMRKELHRIKMLKERIALCKIAGIAAPPSIGEDFFQVTGVHLPEAAQAKLFKGE